MTTSKVLTVTTRILNIAAHLHAKAVGAHRRALTARIRRAQHIRAAADRHYSEAKSAHWQAQQALARFDESLSRPIIVETTIKP